MIAKIENRQALNEMPVNAAHAVVGWDQLPWEDLEQVIDGVDPQEPTAAPPGSEQKVLMLAARYAAGVPLWNQEDSYDHSEAGHEYSQMADELWSEDGTYQDGNGMDDDDDVEV